MESDVPRPRAKVFGLLDRMGDRMRSTPVLVLNGLAQGADQLIASDALRADVYLAPYCPRRASCTAHCNDAILCLTFKRV